MGRIKKVISGRHHMALSPYISDFVSRTTQTPLHKLPQHLDTFPKIAPFPRGDLYHWITVLNRFDDVLKQFVVEYGLDNGPQTVPFSNTLVKRGDGVGAVPTPEELEAEGYAPDADRQLIQSMLNFSLMLLDHNSNRTLYSSSEHLNSLLNTTSLPLLKANLQLCLALAQRYYSSKIRIGSSHHLAALLQSHYNINLDKIQTISEAFAKDSKPFTHYDAIAGQSGNKSDAPAAICHPSDLNYLLKTKDIPEEVKQNIGDINLTFYEDSSSANDANGAPTFASPSSPTPARRAQANGAATESPANEKRDRHDHQEGTNAPKSLHISGQEVIDRSPENTVGKNLKKLPSDKSYDLLHQVRVAYGLRGDKRDLQDLICVRLYALANLSYVYGDNTFHSRIGQADTEQPRDYQIATQLAEMLQPGTDGSESVPLEISIAAVTALEALSKVKSKINDVASALSISVSHGVLFYVLRKVLASLDSDDPDPEQFRWREAVFTLVSSIATPSSHNNFRYTEQLVAAGLITNIVEALRLRTANAEPHYANLLHFFDSFAHNNVRDAFTALINAHGLDVIADLTAFEVSSSLEAVEKGEGLQASYRTMVTDYDIPFYKQQTLRRIVKFIQTLFHHNVGNGDRHLRNFIDSPQLLGALKSIINNATVFGSNVWIGAVNIISSFIHSEPTSYNVIHEAGLSAGILEAIAPAGVTTPDHILPVGETLRDIPAAFGAICLNEAGMKLFQGSKAVDVLLSIFTSSDHVKAMVDDDCAIAIGRSFDELVRHHPDLKDKVHEAILRMLKTTVAYCQGEAVQKGAGAKLWIPDNGSNSARVAGGKQAMIGLSFSGDTEGAPTVKESGELTDAVVGDELTLGTGKSTSDVITVTSRFLWGYLHNSNMLARFCESGGVAYMLDLAVCPCNPWNFHEMSAYNDLAKVFSQVVGAKPHMILPSLVLRTKQILDVLKPVTNYDPQERFFGRWTSFPSELSAENAEALGSGTRLVQALVAVQTLIKLIADAFKSSQSYYSQRSPPQNLFVQINLSDLYVEIIDALGRLHTACVWEEIYLQDDVPKDQAEPAKAPEVDTAMGSAVAAEAGTASGSESQAVVTEGDGSRADGDTSGPQHLTSTTGTEPSSNLPSAAVRNKEIFQHIFNRLPSGIIEFFHQLGKVSFVKGRTSSELYHRNKGNVVAESLAKAMVSQLGVGHVTQPLKPDETVQYEMAILASITSIMVNRRTVRSAHAEILMILLYHFHRHGGILAMSQWTGGWITTLQDSPGTLKRESEVIDSINTVLGFYTQITDFRILSDSPQAAFLTSLSANTENSAPTDVSQLLVELRHAVFGTLMRIWRNPFTKGTEVISPVLNSDAAHSVITILRLILEASGEHAPLTEQELGAPFPSFETTWSIRSPSNLDQLISGGAPRDLAMEAMYRCNENLQNARDYYRVRQANPDLTDRLPPPPEDLEPRSGSEARPTSSTFSQASTSSALARVPSVDMRDADDNDDEERSEVTDDAMVAEPVISTSTIGELPTHNRVDVAALLASPKLPVVSRARLDIGRGEIRSDIVDRSLELLNERPDLSFDISDLITSATSNQFTDSKEATELRESFGETLALTLVSLRSSDEPLPPNSKVPRKISGIAHLLALSLRQDSFFEASIECLKNNFDEFVQFLKVPPDFDEATAEYMSNILAVLERVLIEDESPKSIPFTDPLTQSGQDLTPIQLPPPLIDNTLKNELFDAILELLPRVGKQDGLALAVTRVLVILTRRRAVAERLSEKQNLGRLFLMIKQLTGMVGPKLQSAFMVVLRHLVEDEQIIRQIMVTEIQAGFEGNRTGRSFDVNSYLRNFYHLVLRDPEIFVAVTNEKLKLSRYDASRPSPLVLKASDEQQSSKDDQTNPSTEVSAGEQPQARPPLDRVKTSDMKPPVVEKPDGVIQFLMKELSSYRDVEDKDAPAAPQPQIEPSVTTDIEMADTETPPPPERPIFSSTIRSTPRASDRPTFNSQDHPIFAYRCHLLQCLVELLSSYNHTKVEFINFSPKNDAPSLTPSKPRSGFLHYLLSSLIPVGSLAHAEDIPHRKRLATSLWATSVVVALCTKTPEVAVSPNAAQDSTHEDEPDLVFVQKFVLEQAVKAFNSAMHSTFESPDKRYSRLLSLSELFKRMLAGQVYGLGNIHNADAAETTSKQLGRFMYEKNFVSALTASIAEIDLNFPNARRAIKYILRPLQMLTQVAIDLSLASTLSLPDATSDDEISSATSTSDTEDDRDATPDIFRNSTLGQFEAGGSDDSDSSGDEDEDEEGYYGDEYDEDGMEYEDDRPMADHGDVVSDDDEEIEGMGPIEGISGDVGMNVEIVMDGDSADESSDGDEDDDDEGDDDDDEDHDDDDDIEILDEISEGDGNDSGAEDDHDHGTTWEGDEDEEGLEFQDPMEVFSNVLAGHHDHDMLARLENAGVTMDTDMEGEFFDDEMPPEDEDEDVEDYEEENIVYEPEAEMEDEDDTEEGGWSWTGPAPESFFGRHHHIRVPPDPWGNRDAANEAYPSLRSHRGNGMGRGLEDGLNPLLQRPGFNPLSAYGREQTYEDIHLPIPTLNATGNGRMPSIAGGIPRDLADLISGVGLPGTRIDIIQRDGDVGGRPFPGYIIGGPENAAGPRFLNSRLGGLNWVFRGLRSQEGRSSTHTRERTSTRDPGQAVSFTPVVTTGRWQDEARIIFNPNYLEKATKVLNSILRLLAPPAVDAKRRSDKAEADRKAAEDKLREEREQKEAEERRAQEEREKQEREAREAEEAANREEATTAAPMEDVEETTNNDNSGTAPPTERVTAMVRGARVDITDLGIDPVFLSEIPEDYREEVIMQQLHSRITHQGNAADEAEVPDEIDRDFLNILPSHIQRELLRAEASQRNRRDRDARRAARTAEQDPAAQGDEMDPADFMAMLDPTLRQSVLRDADVSVLNALPEEFRVEARRLFDNDGREQRRHHHHARNDNAEQAPPPSRQKTAIPQILDKAGVATLLRLIFFSLQGSTREAMLHILSNICKNTQTRAEVISILLSVLQDGSSDGIALDKSFTQLTVRAKQMSGPKTPQPLRRTLTGGHVSTPSTDASPLTIVQQCLDALSALAHENIRVAGFFLTEHDTIISQRAKTPKKGKSKESKTSRFPVNALLSLLDRRIIMENATAIEKLANTLVRVTEPLKTWTKRASEQEKQADSSADATAAPEVSMGEGSATDAQAEENKEDKNKKKSRTLQFPEIPEENLSLVVNIIAARECPGKTFQSTLTIVNHLSIIPGAREIFGRELVRRAQSLAAEVLEDLQHLPQHIRTAENSTKMQGLALGSFSPAGSHQNKLLRVLLALDYIFDPKRVDMSGTNSTEGTLQKAKENLVSSLYDNEVFFRLWTVLSDCLTAIRERPAMSNIATILQPIVEAFMVVCKNTAPREMTVSSPQDTAVTTPPPQNRIEGLFFTFTEEHRKILNDLVRQNPKLMSGTFDVLVKNPKVLEFDNKRSFFQKRLHQRESRAQTGLPLNVRRSQVFLDSYKALFFKKPDELKFGRLQVRFVDEEGVDAGGVTREWFAALSRQMFDPNYALYNPVAADRTTFHPNPLSEINPEHLAFFKFIGRIIGKALYEQRVLDCHFSRAVYKRILGKAVSLKDMETLDLEYYKSLMWILENDITDVAFETFSIEVDRFGDVQTVDLIPDGRNIPVTEDNKQEYVRLVVEQRLTKSVEEQLEHFLTGFREIVPLELISIFNEQELELLISGLPDIDVEDWKANTNYQNYTATSPQVQWFWRAVRSFDKEERAKLLQFVTGTSKVPLNGFKELEGMNGINKFNIHRDFGPKDRLPSSHTCFNQLDLPEYESYEILRKQMYTAMTVGSDYFGFA